MPEDMINEAGIFIWNRERQLVSVYHRLRDIAGTTECLELIIELCDLHDRQMDECKQLLAALAIDMPGEYTAVTVSDDIVSIVPFLWRTENEVLEQGLLRLDSMVQDQSGRTVLLRVSETQGRKIELLRRIAVVCKINLIIVTPGPEAPPVTPPHGPVLGVTEYVVQPGDTMFLIAQRYGISLNALIAANPQVRNPDMIFPGEVLRIPGTVVVSPGGGPGPGPGPSGSRRYIVRAGETIEIIAGRFGLNTSELVAFNPQLSDRTVLTPGEVIFIPGAGAVG